MLHPVLACIATVDAAVKDVADVNAAFMSVEDKKSALLGLSTVLDQVEELRLRVLASSDDVAAEGGDRDAAAWLAHRGRRDRGETRRSLLLADALDARWWGVARALREGAANLAQAEAIVRALDALPDDIDPEIKRRAEAQLVGEAAHFGPRSLQVLGRRVLAVVAPDVADEHERRMLEQEEAAAARGTFLRTRSRGDGSTDIHLRVSDIVANRLLTYLEAFTSPRRADGPAAPDDRRPYDQRLGHAFGAFLEAVDPSRLPLHGGDATTMLVTVDLDTLRRAIGAAFVGDSPISAQEARRLACTAQVVPVVLGGKSEILDLGRSRRLFSPAQRKAMAIRDVTCRGEGCDIPAAWCEAHHAGSPWSQGGRTDLTDGVLLCSFHHHRAHDHRYDMQHRPDGVLTFHRRT